MFASGLTCPISLVFAPNGDLLLADAGVSDGNGKVLKYVGDRFVVDMGIQSIRQRYLIVVVSYIDEASNA